MVGTSAADHPDPAILALFAAGRLRAPEAARVEKHLVDCPLCLAELEEVPEDSLVGLLREHGLPGDDPTGEFRDGPAPSSFELADGENLEQPPRLFPEHPRYRMLSLLGTGGMGLLYLAEDCEQGGLVVLKFLRDDLLDRPRQVERFRREAASATSLRHPNIVVARGTETFGRWPALVMEYIDGSDLHRLVQRKGPLPVRVACELIRQAAAGLQHSFEQGMVHRDIKPSNLMVGVDGTVKILDFGLARMRSELSLDVGLTNTGAFLGTVAYMAPEQADDPRRADIRADIYSLGCTLYHLLIGGPPFEGTIYEVLDAHRTIVPTALDRLRPDVPPAIAALAARMLQKDPARRPQAPAEVDHALARFLANQAEATEEPEPTDPIPAADPTRRRASRWLRRLGAMAIGLAAFALAAVAIYRLAFLKARVVFETELPGVEIIVKQSGKRLTTVDTRRTRQIELEPGRYTLDLAADASLRISREAITLRRGDRVPVAVRRVPAEPAPIMAPYFRLMRVLNRPVHSVYGGTAATAGGASGDCSWQIRRMFQSFAWAWHPDPDRPGMVKTDPAPEFRSAESRLNLCVLLALHGWPDLAIEALRIDLEGPKLVLVPGWKGPWLQGGSIKYVLVGTDEGDRLHIRVSGADASILVDTDETRLSGVSQAPKVAALKRRVKGFSRPDLPTRIERDQMLVDVKTILGLDLDVAPGDGDAQFDLGILSLMTGRPVDAIDALRSAIRLAPKDADAHIALGLALAAQGRVDEGVLEIRSALAIRTDDADGWYHLGTVLQEAGRASEAVEAFTRAIRIDEEMAVAHDHVSRALAEIGRKAEADASAKEAARLRDLAIAENDRGVELAEDERLDEAIAAFRRAIRIRPELAEARSNLGAARLGREEPAEAMAALAEAIRLQPRLAAAHANLVIALRRQGQGSPLAGPASIEAVRLKPGIDAGRRHWARTPAASESNRRYRRLPALRGGPGIGSSVILSRSRSPYRASRALAETAGRPTSRRHDLDNLSHLT